MWKKRRCKWCDNLSLRVAWSLTRPISTSGANTARGGKGAKINQSQPRARRIQKMLCMASVFIHPLDCPNIKKYIWRYYEGQKQALALRKWPVPYMFVRVNAAELVQRRFLSWHPPEPPPPPLTLFICAREGRDINTVDNPPLLKSWCILHTPDVLSTVANILGDYFRRAQNDRSPAENDRGIYVARFGWLLYC